MSLVRKTFSWKENIALIFSLLALIISGLSFYFSRADENLKARITRTNIIHSPTGGDTAAIEIAYINGGNHEAIALCPWYQLTDTINGSDGTVTGEFSNHKHYPLIIQPHEIKTVQLKLPVDVITSHPGKLINNEYEYYCAVQFLGINSKAELHKESSDFSIKIVASKKGLHYLKETQELTKYASTVVFSAL